MELYFIFTHSSKNSVNFKKCVLRNEMILTLYERNILEHEVKQQTKMTYSIFIPLVPLLLSTSPMAWVIFSIVEMNKRRIASCEKRSMPSRVHWISLSPYFLTAWSMVPNYLKKKKYFMVFHKKSNEIIFNSPHRFKYM